MLLNEVLVGEWTLGAPQIAVYPKVPGAESRWYDSLVDNVQAPSIFVVQHSYQAYPAYLISYQDLADPESEDEEDEEDESEEEESGGDEEEED